MRKIILATVGAITAMTASSAFAADSASVNVNAVVTPTCDITSSSESLTLTTVDAPITGNFVYQCNFTGSPTLSFQSLKGGVQNSGPDTVAPVNYGIYLNDTAPSSAPSTWLQASAATSPVSYNNVTTTLAPNTAKTPSFAVGLTQPLTVAGTYTDTLTISIAP